MKSPLHDDCVAALVNEFSPEDLWLLNPDHARECELEEELAFLMIVRGEEATYRVERTARAFLERKFPGHPFCVHVFALSAIERTPRPLLVKMALESGRKVYSR